MNMNQACSRARTCWNLTLIKKTTKASSDLDKTQTWTQLLLRKKQMAPEQRDRQVPLGCCPVCIGRSVGATGGLGLEAVLAV